MSESNWKYDLLVLAPVTLLTQANHLALLVGTVPEDIGTFSGSNPKVTDGVAVYHLAHSRATDNPLNVALDGPSDEIPEGVDLALVEQALNALVLWLPQTGAPAPEFDGNSIIAVIEETDRMNVKEKLDTLGLSWVLDDSEI